MQRNKRGASRTPAASALCALLCAMVLSGCASRINLSEREPLAVTGDSAGCYLVLPVQMNRKLVDSISEKYADTEQSKKLLDRIGTVYASFDYSGNVTIAATGSFPKYPGSMMFPSSKGWEKVCGESGQVWYQSGNVRASVPTRGIACVSVGNGMEGMLERLDTPQTTPPDVPPSFLEYSHNAATGSRIALFVADTGPLVTRMLGSDIALPVQYAEIYADLADSDSPDNAQYLISCRIKALDTRSARAVSSIIKLALGIPSAIEGEFVVINGNNPVSIKKLADMAGIFVQ